MLVEHSSPTYAGMCATCLTSTIRSVNADLAPVPVKPYKLWITFHFHVYWGKNCCFSIRVEEGHTFLEHRLRVLYVL
jgi:hypothetical protein